MTIVPTNGEYVYTNFHLILGLNYAYIYPVRRYTL